MVDSQFWKARQAEFERYAQPNQYPELKAIWKAKSGRWELWYGHTPEGIRGSKPEKNHLDTEGRDVFKALAGKAAAGLAGSTRDAEGWELWLDFMRVRGCDWGFHGRGATIYCTEQEWQAGVKDGESLYEVRHERGYTYGDEWKDLPATSQDELGPSDLDQLAAAGEELTPSAIVAATNSDYERARLRACEENESHLKHYHRLEDGSIEHVFASSARCCEKLAAHGEITIEAPAPAAAEVAEPERDIESRKAERRKLCDDYRAECKRAVVKLTDEMIANAANPDWHSRSQVQKWLACDPKYNGEPDRRIRKVFREKPHLKKPNG